MKHTKLLYLAAAFALFFSGCSDDNAINVQPDREDVDSPTNPDNPPNSEHPEDPANPEQPEDPANPERPVTKDDSDGDGLTDVLEEQLGTDPNKADTDGDGINDGDELIKETDPKKADTDDDGLNDGKELEIGTDPKKADTDGDGLDDGKELEIGTDPKKADTDGDGLDDGKELEFGTDPKKADTDGDGINDGDEIARGSDPLKASTDADGDGLQDSEEATLGTNPNSADTDGDGASDLVEFMLKTDPLNPKDNPAAKGIVVFETPYQKKSTAPQNTTLSFIPVIQKIDLYYIAGYTKDAGSSLTSHSNQFLTIIKNLQCTMNNRECTSNADCAGIDSKNNYICAESGKCMKQSTSNAVCFADIYTGYGWYGQENTYTNYQSLSNDYSTTQKGLSKKPADAMNGYNYTQPPLCVVDAAKYCKNNPKCYSGNDRFGCPGFRPDAVKMLIHVSDYTQRQNVSWPTSKMKTVAGVLLDNSIRYASVAQRYCSCNNGMKQLACYAAACNSTTQCYPNCENLSDCSNASKSDLTAMYFSPANNQNIEGFIKKMSMGKELAIEPKVVDVTKDASRLVEQLSVVTTGSSIDGTKCAAVGKIDNSAPFQKLTGVKPATSICYAITAKDNQDAIKATDKPQLLEARIQVTAEGSVLNSDRVYFVVPPMM